MDAAVGIAPADRAGLERLLRYCARPPLAMERLHKRGTDLFYHCPKPQSGAKQGDLMGKPFQGVPLAVERLNVLSVTNRRLFLRSLSSFNFPHNVLI